eukprot:12589845-Alexandrium_andersonii.AAC.1
MSWSSTAINCFVSSAADLLVFTWEASRATAVSRRIASKVAAALTSPAWWTWACSARPRASLTNC